MSPFVFLSVCAGLAIIFGLILLRGSRKSKRGLAIGVWLRRIVGISIAIAGLGLIAIAVSIYQYIKLSEDIPIATVGITAIAAQHYRVHLQRADGKAEQYELYGDEWQLDARIIRWQMPALLAGAPPLYRLERLSGRYGDAKQELNSPRSVHQLDQPLLFDMHNLHKTYPKWLPFVDARFGSAAYLPMLDGATYDVYYAPRGGLIAKPADPHTVRLLDAAGW